MKALLSVYDKTGIVDFARKLIGKGFELVSTGGTFEALKQDDLEVKQVSDITGFPEILGGRVKTLHPTIHGGILAKRDVQDHVDELDRRGIGTIDLVVVNLYPFSETIARDDVTLGEALENIDIGGPTMIRAAGKNFPSVVVVVDPEDYDWLSEAIGTEVLDMDQRRRLAQKAFQHVALYDTIISEYLLGDSGYIGQELTLGYKKIYDLRYGENPHQSASFYSLSKKDGIAGATQLHGKELSYNNILDADAAWRSVSDYDEPTVAIIKHTNPCGLAVHVDQAEAYKRAFQGDPVSAYGGIVAFNRTVNEASANAMRQIFYEIVVAPEFDPNALEILKKKRDLRILAVGDSRESSLIKREVRQVLGGVLVQTSDSIVEDAEAWNVVTNRHPTQEELTDLLFAWKAAKHVKSNAIVLAKDSALLGIGAGQPNRVNSVHLAIRAASDGSNGSVLASDAFFPFPDGLELAAENGIRAVVQPGGSIRDQEVIDAANRLGLAMMFTGVRHFKH